MKNKLLLSIAVIAVIGITNTATLFAVTALDFSSKASSWANANCTQREADKSKFSLNDAVCHTLAENDKQDVAIQALNNKSASRASYPLPLFAGSLRSMPDGTVDTSNAVIVPTDGKVSVITVLKGLSSSGEYIDAGRVDFTVAVNGLDSGFGTFIDKDTSKNIAINGTIPVKAGDMVSIKLKGTDLTLKATNQYGYIYTGVPYTVGVQISQ